MYSKDRATRGLRAPDIRPRPHPRETLGRPWAPNGAKIVFFGVFCTRKCKQRLCRDLAVPLRPPSVSPPSPNCSRTQPLWVIYRCPEVVKFQWIVKNQPPRLTQYGPKASQGQQSSNPDNPCGDHLAPRAAKCHPRCHPKYFSNPCGPKRARQCMADSFDMQVHEEFCVKCMIPLSLSCSLSGSLALYTMRFSILMYAHTSYMFAYMNSF